MKMKLSRKSNGIMMILLAMVLLVTILPLSATAHAEPAPGSSTDLTAVYVSGTATMKVQPDVAYVQLGVITREATAEKANEANRIKMDAVRKALAPYQLKDEEIKTIRFSTYPEYSYKDDERKLIGYQVQHILEIKVRDLQKIGAILDAVHAAGVNEVDSIYFDTEKDAEYELQVLSEAMKNARVKADTIAKALNGKVVGVQSVTYNSPGSGPIITPMYKEGAMMEMAADAVQTAIAPGEMEIRSDVQVIYQVKVNP